MRQLEEPERPILNGIILSPILHEHKPGVSKTWVFFLEPARRLVLATKKNSDKTLNIHLFQNKNPRFSSTSMLQNKVGGVVFCAFSLIAKVDYTSHINLFFEYTLLQHSVFNSAEWPQHLRLGTHRSNKKVDHVFFQVWHMMMILPAYIRKAGITRNSQFLLFFPKTHETKNTVNSCVEDELPDSC